MSGWRRPWWSRTLRNGDDWIREARSTHLGGSLDLRLGGEAFRLDFWRGAWPIRYVVDRESVFDACHECVDDRRFSEIIAALKAASFACYGSEVSVYVPAANAFEIIFREGRSPFGPGRRVFVDGRQGDRMRAWAGEAEVIFEYPVRVDGGPPEMMRIAASTIAALVPVEGMESNRSSIRESEIGPP